MFSRLFKIALIFVSFGLPMSLFAQVTVDFDASVIVGCIPLKVEYVNKTVNKNNYTFKWDLDESQYSFKTDTGAAFYSQGGKKTITLTAFDKNGTEVGKLTKTDLVTVFPRPTVEATVSKTPICVNEAVTFSPKITSNGAQITEWIWDFGDGSTFANTETASHSFSNKNIYKATVYVTDINGCSSTSSISKSVTVVVNSDLPTADFTLDNTTTCDATLDVNFVNKSSFANGNIIGYEWDFGDGQKSTSKDVSHSYTRTGTKDVKWVTLKAMADNGCTSNPKYATITMYDLNPTIKVSDAVKGLFQDPKMACAGNISFSAEGVPDVYKWEWDLYDDATVDGSSSVYSSNIATGGTYKISLTAQNQACSKKVTQTFKVEPEINFDLTPHGKFVCAKEANQAFTPISLNVAPDSIQWYVKGVKVAKTNGTGSTPVLNFKANGEYDMSATLTSVNGCVGSKSFLSNVNVYYPNVDMDRSPKEGCVPLDVTAQNKTTYIVPNNADYVSLVSWDFGDGATDAGKDNVTHTYTQDGDWKLKLHIETKQGCVIDTFKTVRTGLKPTIKFNIVEDTVCAVNGIKIENLSTVKNQDGTTSFLKVDSAYVEFTGSGHAGSASNNRSIAYGDTLGVMSFNNNPVNEPGYYDMKLKMYYNTCMQDTFISKPVFIKGPIVNQESIVIDCKDPYKIDLKEKSLKDATTWKWVYYKITVGTKDLIYTKLDEDNSQATEIPDHDFKPYGKGTGRYISTLYGFNPVNGCVDSSAAGFIITDSKATISVQDTTPCVGTKQALLQNDIKDRQYLDHFQWEMTYPSGYIDNVDDHGSFEHGHKTINYVEFGNTYFHFNKDGKAIQEVADFPEKGVYKLSFIIQDINTCQDTVVMQIRAYKPTADFTVSSITNCLPISVPFTDASTSFLPIVDRKWYTGGQTGSFLTGNQTTVTDVYNDKKAVDVRLDVTDSYGCTDEKIKANAVTPIIPVAQFDCASPKICLGNEAEFTVNTNVGAPYITAVDSFEWDFGDNSPKVITKNITVKHLYGSEITNPTVVLKSYVTSPSSQVCTNTETLSTIDVKKADANFSFLTDKITCQVAMITVNVGYVNRYKSVYWEEVYKGKTTNKGDKTTPMLSFQGMGNHVLRLITTSEYKGCTEDIAEKVYNIPTSHYEIKPDISTVCVNDEIKFKLDDTMNVSNFVHYWSFGDGTFDYVNFDTKHAYEKLVNKGSNIVQFYVDARDDKGSPCNMPVDTIITVHQIIADFNRGDDDKTINGCIPFEVQFKNLSQGVKNNSYHWEFSDGTVVDGVENPTHTFTTPQTSYSVKLHIDGDVCSDDQIKSISTYPDPVVFNSVKNPICEDSVLQVVLTPSTGSTIDSLEKNSSIISQSTDLTNITVKPLKTTIYNVYSHYDNVGDVACKKVFPVEVKVQQRPSYNGAPHSPLVYLPDDTLITAPKDQLYSYVWYSLNNDSLDGIIYKWQPSTGLSCDDCANPNIMLEKDATYSVTMKDALGCFTVVETINLKTILETVVGLPSAFTPNLDGKNDMVIPRGWGIKEFLQLDIYNRWGQLVYTSNEIEKGWDGTFNGKPQDPDTYAWVIKYKDAHDKSQEKKGYITLLR